MHILHVYKTYFPDNHGGVEQFIKTLSQTAASTDCSHRLLTLSQDCKPEKLELSGLEVIRYPISLDLRSCPISFALLRKFNAWASQADIIHYHFPWPFADLLHLFKNIKKPSLATYHSDIVRQRVLKIVYKPLMKSFLKNLDYIVPTSENYLNSSEDLAAYRDKCRIIPIGLAATDYPIPKQDLLKQWSAKLPPKFLLFVGVLRYYKGLHVLLQAAETTSIPIIIAGTGPLEQALKKQAALAGLKHVHFLGFINDEDKNALLSLCRAVVFPSHLRSEAFGITLVEGLMFGKPLLSCDISTGTSFINQDHETGYVVPPNDPVKFRDAMLKLYNDDELASRMGKAAQLRYRTYFTAAAMGERYLEIYKNLAAACQSP